MRTMLFKPAVQFTDFTPEVTMTGSAYSSTTKSYSQTISTDSEVYLLTDFTNSTSHMNVALGKLTKPTSPFLSLKRPAGLAPSSVINTCASTFRLAMASTFAVGPNAEGSSIGDGWALGTSTNASGDDYLLYRWINAHGCSQSGIAGSSDRRFSYRQPMGGQPSWADLLQQRKRVGASPRRWLRNIHHSGSQCVRFHVRRSLGYRMRRRLRQERRCLAIAGFDLGETAWLRDPNRRGEFWLSLDYRRGRNHLFLEWERLHCIRVRMRDQYRRGAFRRRSRLWRRTWRRLGHRLYGRVNRLSNFSIAVRRLGKGAWLRNSDRALA